MQPEQEITNKIQDAVSNVVDSYPDFSITAFEIQQTRGRIVIKSFISIED